MDKKKLGVQDLWHRLQWVTVDVGGFFSVKYEAFLTRGQAERLLRYAKKLEAKVEQLESKDGI